MRLIKLPVYYIVLGNKLTALLYEVINQTAVYAYRHRLFVTYILQEAQVMLTNPRDAFRGQSRSPTIFQFHILGVVSY